MREVILVGLLALSALCGREFSVSAREWARGEELHRVPLAACFNASKAARDLGVLHAIGEDERLTEHMVQAAALIAFNRALPAGQQSLLVAAAFDMAHLLARQTLGADVSLFPELARRLRRRGFELERELKVINELGPAHSLLEWAGENATVGELEYELASYAVFRTDGLLLHWLEDIPVCLVDPALELVRDGEDIVVVAARDISDRRELCYRPKAMGLGDSMTDLLLRFRIVFDGAPVEIPIDLSPLRTVSPEHHELQDEVLTDLFPSTVAVLHEDHIPVDALRKAMVLAASEEQLRERPVWLTSSESWQSAPVDVVQGAFAQLAAACRKERIRLRSDAKWRRNPTPYASAKLAAVTRLLHRLTIDTPDAITVR